MELFTAPQFRPDRMIRLPFCAAFSNICVRPCLSRANAAGTPSGVVFLTLEDETGVS